MVGSTAYYLHQDALGSTRLVATGSFTITFSSNYVPYGSNYAISGKEVFRYTGKPYDSSTGLYYYGARFYDDSIGRFITQDSYSGTKTDPMSMNLYIYARDNPERYVDPDGHILVTAHEYYTDTEEGQYLTTTNTCINGVCTTTTTESYGGYTSTITTQVSTTTSTIATPTSTAYLQTTSFNTVTTDSGPGGNTRISASVYTTSAVNLYYSQPTIGTTPTPSTAAPSTQSSSNTKAVAFGFLVAEYVGTGAGGAAFEPSLLLTVPGCVDATDYFFTNPNPTPSGVLYHFAEGMDYALHFISNILPVGLPP